MSVKTISRALRPTDNTAIRSRTRLDVVTSSPHSGTRYTRERTPPNNHRHNVPAYDSPGAGCLAVRRNEDYERSRCNGHYDGSPQHYVHDQKNRQQRHHAQSTLEEVALPVATELFVRQPASEHQLPHRPLFAKLAHHKRARIIPSRPEVCHTLA